jgi:hypothetical protein
MPYHPYLIATLAAQHREELRRCADDWRLTRGSAVKPERRRGASRWSRLIVRTTNP